MAPDLTEYFSRYETLAAEIDMIFDRVKQATGGCVTCAPGCDDCCHALFDLSLIEALYLNAKFNERFSAEERQKILDRANTADRQVYKIKKKAFDASQEGEDQNAILDEMARQRVRCALLNDEGRCDLYDHRPLTCRVYGIPTAIGGKACTCGLSGFKKGQPYPTVNIEKLQDRLMLMSKELIQNLGSTQTLLPEVLVPVSMALLTTYDDAYLGIPEKKSTVKVETEGKTTSWSIGEDEGEAR